MEGERIDLFSKSYRSCPVYAKQTLCRNIYNVLFVPTNKLHDIIYGLNPEIQYSTVIDFSALRYPGDLHKIMDLLNDDDRIDFSHRDLERFDDIQDD